MKVREEAKREFQAKLDQIIETHTSDVTTKVTIQLHFVLFAAKKRITQFTHVYINTK